LGFLLNGFQEGAMRVFSRAVILPM
jgi:hypothetical protein